MLAGSLSERGADWCRRSLLCQPWFFLDESGRNHNWGIPLCVWHIAHVIYLILQAFTWDWDSLVLLRQMSKVWSHWGPGAWFLEPFLAWGQGLPCWWTCNPPTVNPRCCRYITLHCSSQFPDGESPLGCWLKYEFLGPIVPDSLNQCLQGRKAVICKVWEMQDWHDTQGLRVWRSQV